LKARGLNGEVVIAVLGEFGEEVHDYAARADAHLGVALGGQLLEELARFVYRHVALERSLAGRDEAGVRTRYAKDGLFRIFALRGLGTCGIGISQLAANPRLDLGSDVGGGAIRKLDYLVATGAGPARPVWIVNSTFGGKAGFGNSCANGGALSSIGVSWNILNSLLSENTAVGHGANDGQGGNGGAVYNDGNEIVLNITSSLLENNIANEGGSAVFFVSNDRSGSVTIKDSITQNNPRGTFETADLPGFYVLAKAPANVINSQILR